MTAANKRRAEAVGARPDVQRWIKRFQRVARDMPKDVLVFCGESNVIMAHTEDGRHPCKDDKDQTMDPDGVIEFIRGGSWEGGAW